MHGHQILGCAIVLGTILVLSLDAVGVMQHRTSLLDSGSGLLRMDVALLLAYGIAGILAWKQRSSNAITAAIVGAQIGLVLGAVEIANLLIERLFRPESSFSLSVPCC